ncbi:unnamed protein product [Vitrella brassicaformis CCMP3155]|uniref:Uncharacterized protein n=2 Tax=Vitrella brassicaformis TaxID=1169539 RepID=A0A0G4G2P2_VITBC|nr:unnamed protein product [Vitrella brassicaformis CCMP3155]|eukprot:CEM21954.1 unnamed protein product [Vitrella brassicaformis CCMP3155]
MLIYTVVDLRAGESGGGSTYPEDVKNVLVEILARVCRDIAHMLSQREQLSIACAVVVEGGFRVLRGATKADPAELLHTADGVWSLMDGLDDKGLIISDTEDPGEACLNALTAHIMSSAPKQQAQAAPAAKTTTDNTKKDTSHIVYMSGCLELLVPCKQSLGDVCSNLQAMDHAVVLHLLNLIALNDCPSDAFSSKAHRQTMLQELAHELSSYECLSLVTIPLGAVVCFFRRLLSITFEAELALQQLRITLEATVATMLLLKASSVKNLSKGRVSFVAKHRLPRSSLDQAVLYGIPFTLQSDVDEFPQQLIRSLADKDEVLLLSSRLDPFLELAGVSSLVESWFVAMPAGKAHTMLVQGIIPNELYCPIMHHATKDDDVGVLLDGQSRLQVDATLDRIPFMAELNPFAIEGGLINDLCRRVTQKAIRKQHNNPAGGSAKQQQQQQAACYPNLPKHQQQQQQQRYRPLPMPGAAANGRFGAGRHPQHHGGPTMGNSGGKKAMREPKPSPTDDIDDATWADAFPYGDPETNGPAAPRLSPAAAAAAAAAAERPNQQKRLRLKRVQE